MDHGRQGHRLLISEAPPIQNGADPEAPEPEVCEDRLTDLEARSQRLRLGPDTSVANSAI
jgi:hypothetical protein